MIRKIILLLIIGVINIADIRSQTILGLRAGGWPSILMFYDSLNADASRQIIKDHQLRPTDFPLFKAQLEDLKNKDVETIVCLRFPTDSLDSDEIDRVPYLDAADLDSSLLWASQFIIAMDTMMDYVQIQNEPIAGPGKFLDTLGNALGHMGYYAYKWMDTLGAMVNQTILNNGLSTKVVSPGFHSVASALDTTSLVTNPVTYIRNPGDTVWAGTITTQPVTKYLIHKMIEVAKLHSDVIDIHMNVGSVDDIVNRISSMDSLQAMYSTTLPYSSYEWSQTKEKDSLINSSPSLQNFLDSAYTFGVSLADWQSFILDSLDYDTTFMQNAFCAFEENNFVHACYAGLSQYGSSLNDMIFSTCALITNRVTNPPDKNEPFYSLFNQITPCPATGYEGPASSNQDASFSVFPNPFDDSFAIEMSSRLDRNFQIKIFNIYGQELYHYPISSDRSAIHNTKLKPGTYLFLLYLEDNLVDSKVTISR